MLVCKPFSQTTLISEVEPVTSGVQNCQVAGLVPALWQPGSHFGTLGAHWGTTGAADRTASWSMIFRDWRWISDRMLGVSEQSLVFENQVLWFGVYFSKSACAVSSVWLAGRRCLFFIFPNLCVCWLAGFWMLVFRSCFK